MVRKVFFSFHYERDAQRAAVVRNHAVTKEHDEDAGYLDKAAWESLERQGTAAVQKWISEQLKGTSVTVVLIGPETSSRAWVRYEIVQSYAKGNGLVGIALHNIPDFGRNRDTPGNTNFGVIGKDKAGKDVMFSSVAKTYDWMDDHGYINFSTWIEDAIAAAAKRN